MDLALYPELGETYIVSSTLMDRKVGLVITQLLFLEVACIEEYRDCSSIWNDLP
jgi:hypothetical protein